MEKDVSGSRQESNRIEYHREVCSKIRAEECVSNNQKAGRHNVGKSS